MKITRKGLCGTLWLVLVLPAVADAKSPVNMVVGHQAILRGTHDFKLEPGEGIKVDDFYCALGATAYLRIDRSTAYPVLLQVFGGTYQTSGRGDTWQKQAWQNGDYAADSSLPFGSIFGFHVTNQSNETIVGAVNAYC